MNIPIDITASHLWSVFSFIVIFFIISILILMHHWNYYGIKGNSKLFVKSLFFIGSGFILFSMAILILVY